MQHEGKSPCYPGGAPSGLWLDVIEIPSALTASLERRDGFDAAVKLVKQEAVSRLVVSGNGAAYYVATTLWLASLCGQPGGPTVCAVPSGLVARGRFPWQPGDMFVAVSSSGEFRDLVEAVTAGAPRPYIAITSSPASTVARSAHAAAVFYVLGQRALTHSQVVCGGIATALAVWAGITNDDELSHRLNQVPALMRSAIERASQWYREVLVNLPNVPRSAVVSGTRTGWAAALQAALLLKEVARVPAEGAETREAATSGMYALTNADLAFTLPTGQRDALLDEAERIFRRAGATVLRSPSLPYPIDERLTGILHFPASAALALTLARRGGFDIDRPSWATAYYATAR